MNVLKVMKEAFDCLQLDDRTVIADELIEARAAVAELIEANKEYFAAEKAVNSGLEFHAKNRMRAALAKASP